MLLRKSLSVRQDSLHELGRARVFLIACVDIELEHPFLVCGAHRLVVFIAQAALACLDTNLTTERLDFIHLILLVRVVNASAAALVDLVLRDIAPIHATEDW